MQWLTVNEIVDYIYRLTGLVRTRQTIYKWAKVGKKTSTNQAVKLRIITRLGRFYSTETWVREFIERI